MKAYKSLLFVVLVLAPLWTLAAQQKYALVIGNAAYTNITRLNNPVNDANDMAAALQSLGFQVDKVLNGSLDQMENAIVRLKNRLSTNAASYGFFFYAGHGVQSNGENYLIPVDANIASESFLRQRAVQMQAVLDELNQAENALNIVILDACRDNPFSWSRSGSRGLQVVGSQPADSIIVYATGSGQVAQDGTGRNGLFTEQLLKNIKTPGLSVRDIFDRTGADVARVSGRRQIPAIYSQFFGTAYLAGTAVAPAPATAPQGRRIYKIGDTGPAGGIVFYDKGVHESGWRYLEAAPYDFTNVQWSEERLDLASHYYNIANTKTNIGSGKRNTELILAEMKRREETGKAAQLCAALDYGGYTDWFLPGFEELKLMYINLKTKGLGGFSPSYYWSSSQVEFPMDGWYYAYVHTLNFTNGSDSHGGNEKAATLLVRAVRSF